MHVAPSVRRFAFHYLEMVVAMVLGMVLLGMAVDAVADIDGTGPMLIEMGVIMTIPMVAWMRVRGHEWRPTLEMAASMVLPTLGALALLWSGLVEGTGALMVIEHAVMLPSMLVAMLLRRDEYGRDHRAHRAPAVSPAA
jgi:flagellar biosynthetic protein FliP